MKLENKEDYFMEDNVFVSGIQINDIKKGEATYQQMSINYCDRNGEESSFLTSIMPESSMEQYQSGLLGALNSRTLTGAIYGAVLTDLTAIKDSDDQKHLIGFESSYGLILKYEVRLYNQEQAFEQ